MPYAVQHVGPRDGRWTKLEMAGDDYAGENAALFKLQVGPAAMRIEQLELEGRT